MWACRILKVMWASETFAKLTKSRTRRDGDGDGNEKSNTNSNTPAHTLFAFLICWQRVQFVCHIFALAKSYDIAVVALRGVIHESVPGLGVIDKQNSDEIISKVQLVEVNQIFFGLATFFLGIFFS